MRKPAAALLLVVLLAPGCAFAQRAIPLDASGMDYTLDLWGRHLGEQVDRTGDTVANLPRSFSDHVARCWRNLSEDPTDM